MITGKVATMMNLVAVHVGCPGITAVTLTAVK